MDKTFALFMTALLLLSGCLGADDDSISDAITMLGCNDATALNYDANNSAAESVNTTAFCASEEALEQGIMEFIQFMDEGPEDNITTTIGYSMQVSEASEGLVTQTYTEYIIMTPTGFKVYTADNYGEDFSVDVMIMSGNQIQYSTLTNESNMTVRMTHAHGFMKLMDDMEDDGMEDDGMEDDGMEDDGMEDDGMEDDGMEEGEEVDPAPEDYTPYFTTNATFEDFSITEAGMSFTGLLNVAGAPFGELVVYTTTDFAVTGFTLVDVNEANNYVRFTLINSGEAAVDETIPLSALPFLLLGEEMMSMLGDGDDNNGGDQFMCDDGEQIPADWVNDGMEDCADGSDEFDDNDGNSNGQTDSWSFDRDVAACDEDNDSMVDYQEFINCIENDLTNDGYGSMNADDVDADMMFEIGDMDNNSLLNESELSYINQMINGDDGNNNDEAPSPEEAMNASDADGNGAVSWSEFTAEWNSNWAESGNLSDDSGFESQLFSAFNDSDMDNSGDLNLTELELFIDEVDMIMNTDYSNASTPEEMFSMFDLDGNSQINVSELFIGLDPNDTMSQEDQYNIDSMYNMYVGDNSDGLNMTEFTSLWDEMNSDDNGDDNGDDNDNGGDNGDDNGGEGTDEDTGDSETLYIMGFFPAEGVLDDYSLVLANCVMSEQSMTPESCEEGVYSVVLSSIVMDGNSTSNPGVMFMDTDASGTLSSGDMIIIDHSELNLTEEWNTPRLHSEEANAYADENPMMPGFTGILATLGLLGAALSRRE